MPAEFGSTIRFFEKWVWWWWWWVSGDMEEREGVEDSVKNNLVLKEYDKSVFFIRSNG